MDDGGGESSGGEYTLTDTLGQPDAEVHSGGNYTLQGGFLLCTVLHDVDGDGLVTVDDIQFVVSRWRSPDPGVADRDGDGEGTVRDIMLVVIQWAYGC